MNGCHLTVTKYKDRFFFLVVVKSLQEKLFRFRDYSRKEEKADLWCFSHGGHWHRQVLVQTSKRLLSPSPLQAPTMAAEPTTINGSLLGYLRTAVKLVSSQYAYTSTAFDDLDETVSVLCDAITRVLMHGLSARSGVVSLLGLQTPPSFWPYVEQLETVGGDRGACIPWIRAAVTSNDARAKTWVKLALNRHHLGACIADLARDQALTAKFYEDGCILRTREDCQIMLTLMEGLSTVAFALRIDEKLQRIVQEAWPSAKPSAFKPPESPGGSRGIIPTPHLEDIFVVPETKTRKKHPKKRIIILRDEVDSA